MNSTPLFGFGEGSHSETLVSSAHKAEIQAPSTSQLSPFIQILDIFFRQKASGEFLTATAAFNDTVFTGQRPIVGVGHNFVVYASPFARLDTVPSRVAKTGGEVYCIKSPNLDKSHGDAAFRNEYCYTVLQELRVLSHPNLIDHENITGLLGLDFLEDFDDYRVAWPMILVEYSEFGTLDAFQQDLGPLHPTVARNLLLDIGTGLQSLHDCNIIHGDVKSENVLVYGHRNRQYVAKLSDFGLAIINPSTSKTHNLPGCTWMWSAPECQQQLTVTGLKLTDVYSFGLTAWRVLTNRQDPFQLLSGHLRGYTTYRQGITQMKLSNTFMYTVQQSIAVMSGPEYSHEVILATLNVEPGERSLEAALRALSANGSFRTIQ